MLKINLLRPANVPRASRLWVSPHNPTIMGDADRQGNLIPGRVWSGGLSSDPNNSLTKVLLTKFLGPDFSHLQTMLDDYPRLSALVTALNEEYPVIGQFVKSMPEAFWQLMPDRYAVRVTLQVMTLDLSVRPDGHILEDSEVPIKIKISEDARIEIDSGMRVFVYSNFTGSLLRIFEKLDQDHWEVRFMKNFTSEDSQGYAMTAVFPKGAAENPRTRYHTLLETTEQMLKHHLPNGSSHDEFMAAVEKMKGIMRQTKNGTKMIFDTVEDQKTLKEVDEKLVAILTKDKRAKIIAALSEELLLEPSSQINRLVDEYLAGTLPQMFLAYESKRLVEEIKYFHEMDNQTQGIVVADHRSDTRKKRKDEEMGVNRIYTAIKGERITPLLLQICKILQEREIGIRYFLVSSLPGPNGNKTLCSIGIQDNEGDPLRLSVFEGVRQLIQDLAKPTFGVKSLFDILGPIMIGPSSSHTAGACKIGRLSRNIFEALFELGVAKDPAAITVEMVRTFALENTGKGHYSDLAVCGGLLGIKEDDAQLETVVPPSKSSELTTQIKNNKVKIKPLTDKKEDPSVHPNTIRIKLLWEENAFEISGASVGGGIIGIQTINGEKFEYKADNQAIRGNLPLCFIILKKGKTINDLQPKLDTNPISIVQIRELSVGGNQVVILCSTKKVDFGKDGFDEIIERTAQIKTINETQSASFLSEFSSFSDILDLVGEGRYEKLSDLALSYEKKLTPRTDGESEKDLETRVMGHMQKRLEVILESVEKGHGKSFFIGGQEIGNLPELILKLANILPIKEERFREIMKEFLNNSEDLTRKLEGRVLPRVPFEVDRVWPYVAANPAVRKILTNFLKEYQKHSIPEGQLDQNLNGVFAKIKTAWENNPLAQNIYSSAMAYAEAVSIHNASMGKIVAAPTAGSAGVLPGVLRAMKEFYKLGEDEVLMEENLTKALFTAALIGLVINDKVETAGGTGGCQAELGAATAMAAGAATELLGGTPEKVVNAVALSLQFLEGLVCDPIGGYVVWPCIPRNGFAATIALAAAWQAVNMKKSLLSADDAINAIRDTASKMHFTLKEWGRDGGLSSTDQGKKIGNDMRNNGCKTCSKGCT